MGGVLTQAVHGHAHDVPGHVVDHVLDLTLSLNDQHITGLIGNLECHLTLGRHLVVLWLEFLALKLDHVDTARLDLEDVLVLFNDEVIDDRWFPGAEQFLFANVCGRTGGRLERGVDILLIIHDPIPRNVVLDPGQGVVPVLTEQTNLAPEPQHILVHGSEVIQHLFKLGVDFFSGNELLDHLLAH